MEADTQSILKQKGRISEDKLVQELIELDIFYAKKDRRLIRNVLQSMSNRGTIKRGKTSPFMYWLP